ncbi:flagellar hook-associated protein FlgK [Intestinimonas butyriciproducens]|uniref:flagellar hook-associated protein FlgK n=1 Tax=Intestinimonas butyriciproducens TaxID=1297617 RepID=UPI00195E9FF4|nr:flagellar basal body rod C-terminal domain-containing protein [Intestinimonas butyriciproducens]MBM6975753.1 flagellar hook-associated protein FlgK [Intestinimonas butyriciproducens]
MSSTFGCFSTARLGIYAAQKGLDVTGNNITNINTPGYTRQRLDQVSLVTTASDKYFSQYNTRVGQGVLTTGVSQIRDPGLDLLYRSAQAHVGSYGQMLSGLDDIASILDEVGKGDGEQDDGVILNQMNDLRDLISQAITSGMDGGTDRLIYASAKALCRLFNKAANDLTELKGTYESYLEQDVSRVNTILSNIQELNVSIRNADIRGDEALELRDQRNMLLDELSSYVKIDVKYSDENVGAGLVVEKLTVSLATGDKNTLVDGEYASQLSLGTVPMPNPDYDGVNVTDQFLDPDGNPTNDPALAAQILDDTYPVTVTGLKDLDGVLKPGATDAPLEDNDLYGSIQSLREILTEKGEYSTQNDVNTVDPDAAIKRGIPYYQMALDSLAKEFAEQMNALNTPGANITGEGALFSMGSNNNDTTNITASNISVSQAWGEGNVTMIASQDPNASSGDTSNLAAFLNLFTKKQAFDPKDVAGADAVGAIYNGSFEDMLLRIQSTLAEDQMTTGDVYNNYTLTSNEIYTDRDSVSGVDLNDEATNLMVYQKAYAAACRLMTTLNTALDSLLAM